MRFLCIRKETNHKGSYKNVPNPIIFVEKQK